MNCWTAEALVRLARVANDERLVTARELRLAQRRGGSSAAHCGAEAIHRPAQPAVDQRPSLVASRFRAASAWLLGRMHGGLDGGK